MSLASWNTEALISMIREEGVELKGLTTAQVGEIQSLQSEYADLLLPKASDARDLLERAFEEYWRLEMFQRAPQTADPSQPPPTSFPSARGNYNLSFAGLGGGWKIWVSLDSYDFPELDGAIIEIDRLKQEFAGRVLRVLD